MQVLLSLGGALLAIVVFLLVPRASATHHVLPGRPSVSPTWSTTGGGAWLHTYWPVGATWPLVRLDLLPWGVKIGPSSPKFKWLLPTTELAWNEIRSATPTRTGIRFRRVDAPGWVIFSSFSGLPPELWRQLEDHGVPSGE